MKKAKIVATLGPSSAKPDVLKDMLEAGVNVIRLNMSHSTQDYHQGNIAMVRKVAAETKRPVAIIGDLQGPKIRTGRLKDNKPFSIAENSMVTLTSTVELGEPGTITTDSVELMVSLEPGSIVLINDGKIKLEVQTKPSEQTATCLVINGGLIEERKGINTPNTHLKVPCLTDKDYADALFCVRQGVDYLALSFVQHASDIDHLRKFIQDNTPDQEPYALPAIIAKIEKPEALKHIDAILETTDALMVARGDLGVELSPELVPTAQKDLINRANRSGKPVIVATQMLESMMTVLQPSRAEVSDVANAILDGADAVMLSGETAMGNYPVETVRMMSKIVQEAETHYHAHHIQVRAPQTQDLTLPQVVAHSACYASNLTDVKAIVALSTSGRMAQRISKLKPPNRIIALVSDQRVYQRASLYWGVTPLVIPFGQTTDETLAMGEALMLELGLLEPNDKVIFCAGSTPLHGTTHMLKVERIKPLGSLLPEVSSAVAAAISV